MTYEDSIFINCPFDDSYVDILHAITFTVIYAGFIPRSALEEVNSGDERLSKIIKIVRGCCLSLHDISRVESSGVGSLPRFNMPFECGIFYGALSFGSREHRKKQFLVLDSEPYRYQKTMSDISGKDPACHKNDPLEAISCVRNFLNGKKNQIIFPGEKHFKNEYARFKYDLPKLLASMKLTEDEIRKLSYWKDYVSMVKAWADSKATTA